MDRAKLRNNKPELSKLSPEQGILGLVCGEIRNESVTAYHDGEKKPPTHYEIDVKSDPLSHNISHAIIVPSPKYKSDNAFKKVKETLARLAEKRGWIIEPQE